MKNDIRLIDANTLEAMFLRLHVETDPLDNDWFTPYLLVKDAPTIDAAPVVHGRWKWEGRFKACSECGSYIDFDNTLGAGHWHYCPNCGAKMDGGAEK